MRVLLFLFAFLISTSTHAQDNNPYVDSILTLVWANKIMVFDTSFSPIENSKIYNVNQGLKYPERNSSSYSTKDMNS